MNANKPVQTPKKYPNTATSLTSRTNHVPPTNARSSSSGTGAVKPNGLAPGYGYQPKFTPPPEPAAPPPPPNVENNIEIPGTMEITTMTDIVTRALENAKTLFPGYEKLRITTAVSPNGFVCHALVVAPKNEERPHSRYKTVFKGPGVPGTKAEPAKGRRKALAGLLEMLEKKVGVELEV